MLEKPEKKTASAPKSTNYIWIAVLSCVLFLLMGWVLLRMDGKHNFGLRQVHYTRLVTPGDRVKGLSGRQSLPEDQAMLFVFDKSDTHCFWMKNMKFPIDIIWLDETKKIVMVKDEVQPETYPESFCPDKPAKYVIEVNAGLAQQAQVVEGSRLQF